MLDQPTAAPAFAHQHTAHCESGVVSTLLKHHGLDLDEAMVFGLSSALTFVYLPLVRLAGMPLVSYRMPPKRIIKNTCKQLGIPLHIRQFASPAAGMAALDEALAAGRLVGLQTSVYWLPYFPPEMRFHFNAHNLLGYQKQGDEYLISDPVFEHVQRCAAADLQRARFAKGALAAKGLMYTLHGDTVPKPDDLDWPVLIKTALLNNVRNMQAPLFFVGIKGIRTLARKIERLAHSRQSEADKKLYLGHLVRMQEEIGTGGAGFRYLYAYFLEQAAARVHEPALQQASAQMTAIGDHWRQFASQAVRQCRKPRIEGYAELADFLRTIAQQEDALWQDIRQIAARL